MLLLAPALAASPPVRLVLVGDTGEDTAVARRVAEAVRGEVASGGARVVALGDLFYDEVPVGGDCVAQVVARYRQFYEGIPAEAVIGVTGNHDVTTTAANGFDPAARACTVGAFQALGWTPPDTRVERLDARGVKVDLVVVDAGWLEDDGSHPGGTPPATATRKRAHWVLYANHYTWLTSTGKCSEAGRTWAWMGRPEMDLWLNGHAHHLEAIPVGGALAVTSGGGMQLRPAKACEGVSGSLFMVAKGATEQGGYVRLDVESRRSARLTPVLCEAGGACEEQPALTCTRTRPGRGVSCQ